MSPLAQALVQYVLPALVVALLPLIGSALLSLTSLLQARKNQGIGWHALAVLADVVRTQVAHAEVELRPMYQKALEDGRLTPEEGAQLKAAVIASVMKSAPGAILDAARQVLGGALETWLSGQVELANATGPKLALARVPSSALPTPPIRGQAPVLVQPAPVPPQTPPAG